MDYSRSTVTELPVNLTSWIDGGFISDFLVRMRVLALDEQPRVI